MFFDQLRLKPAAQIPSRSILALLPPLFSPSFSPSPSPPLSSSLSTPLSSFPQSDPQIKLGASGAPWAPPAGCGPRLQQHFGKFWTQKSCLVAMISVLFCAISVLKIPDVLKVSSCKFLYAYTLSLWALYGLRTTPLTETLLPVHAELKITSSNCSLKHQINRETCDNLTSLSKVRQTGSIVSTSTAYINVIHMHMHE